MARGRYEGDVLEAVVTSKRNKAAALKLLKRIMKKYEAPRSIAADRLRAYSAAMKEIGSAAAGLTNDGRRFAGNRRFVDRGHPFDDIAIAGDDVTGLDAHDIAHAEIERVHPFEVLGIDVALGVRVAAGAAQGVGLRLASPFGEIRKQHREPKPSGDLAENVATPAWVRRAKSDRKPATVKTTIAIV